VQIVELATQVLKPHWEHVDKPVPKFTTQVRERVVEVPQVLVEEKIVEIPQANIVEVTREELAPVYQEVVREIPVITMNYVERVVEVQTAAVNESQAVLGPPQPQMPSPLPVRGVAGSHVVSAATCAAAGQPQFFWGKGRPSQVPQAVVSGYAQAAPYGGSQQFR